MGQDRAVISHVVINCFDFAAMVAYYTKTLGFYLSDIGKIGETELCFLTFDPERVRAYYAQQFAQGQAEVRSSFAGVQP